MKSVKNLESVKNQLFATNNEINQNNINGGALVVGPIWTAVSGLNFKVLDQYRG